MMRCAPIAEEPHWVCRAAFQLCTTETTVKIQRHQVMEKMGAGSLAELARMAGRLKAPVPK
jgi:FixJ family two-component response regulator